MKDMAHKPKGKTDWTCIIIVGIGALIIGAIFYFGIFAFSL